MNVRARPVNPYRSIAQVSFLQAIAYRRTTLIQISLTFITVFVVYFLWRAAYATRPAMAGYSWEDMRTYVVLAFGINSLVGWRSSSQMMETVRSGDVVREMVRPLNFPGTQLARAAGSAVIEGMIGLLLTIAVGVLLLGIRPPATASSVGPFVASVVLAFVTKALIMFCVSLLAFWTTSGLGIMWSQEAIMQILSGTIVPIALMPAWLAEVANALPMRGVVATPVTLYLGKADGMGAVVLLGGQVAWLVALWVVANLASTRAFNVVDVQGG